MYLVIKSDISKYLYELKNYLSCLFWNSSSKISYLYPNNFRNIKKLGNKSTRSFYRIINKIKTNGYWRIDISRSFCIHSNVFLFGLFWSHSVIGISTCSDEFRNWIWISSFFLRSNKSDQPQWKYVLIKNDIGRIVFVVSEK